MKRHNSPYRNIWITGASDGIGKALALVLSQKYSFTQALVLSGRNEKKLSEVKNQCKEINMDIQIDIQVFDCQDITRSKEIAENLAGKIDGAIFCAGISQRALSFEMQRETDEMIYNINFLSPIESSKSLIQSWRSQSARKKIIFISSIAGQIPSPLRAMYGASKRALEYYCRISRNELSKIGIRHIDQSIVIPGFVNTNISQKALCADAGSWNKMDNNQAQAMSAEKATIAIIKLLEDKKKYHKKDIYIGMNATLRVITFFSRRIPKLADYILSKVNTAK